MDFALFCIMTFKVLGCASSFWCFFKELSRVYSTESFWFKSIIVIFESESGEVVFSVIGQNFFFILSNDIEVLPEIVSILMSFISDLN